MFLQKIETRTGSIIKVYDGKIAKFLYIYYQENRLFNLNKSVKRIASFCDCKYRITKPMLLCNECFKA